MILNVQKQDFVNNIVNPVSKISDNLCLTFEAKNDQHLKVKTKASSSDGSFNLFSEIDCRIQEPISCIIPDCKTFLRLFSNIQDEQLVLNINNNYITYNKNDFSFKYHLLDDAYYTNKRTLSEEKINALQYDTSFVISKQKLAEVIRFHSIIPDAEKLYFYSKNNKVYAKIGDEQKANTNEIELELSSDFTGIPLNATLPINIQNLLLFSFSTDTISVCINHELKVFKFASHDLKYVLSGLVK